MITKKNYSVNKIKQLIDLNGDTVNFDISFKVSSKNKQPFQMLVVDQTTLDNSPSLEYKTVDNGEISGNIVQDKNVYQNYFLILKADNQTECLVEIAKKELPKTVNQPVLPILPVQEKPPGKSSGFGLKKILLIVGVIALIGFGYYMYSRKANPQETNLVQNEVSQKLDEQRPIENMFRFYSPPKSSSRSPAESPVNLPVTKVPDIGKTSDLLERLKKLNLN